MADIFYQRKRDRAFMAACEKAIKEYVHRMSLFDCITIASRQSTESFFLSIDDYLRIIKSRNMCPPLNLDKAELRDEILRRYYDIKQNTNSTDIEIAQSLEMQAAPRFYISPKRAMSLYRTLLKKRP